MTRAPFGSAPFGLAALLLTVGCLFLPPPVQGAPAPVTVTITDYLGVDWQDDLVHYPLEFAAGEFPGAAQVEVSTGGRALPSQVSDVVRHPDGSIRSLNVWFFATVPADTAVSYLLTPGKRVPPTPG